METKLIKVHPETPTVTSFIFEKPPGFTFQAGQFLNLELPIPDCDARCNKRNISIASSPAEPFLRIAMCHGVSKFKQTLERMPLGTIVQFKGPLGHFVLNENASIPGVFLSGGIGITPLYSMIKYATDKTLPKELTLIYSNANTDDIPFKSHLDEIDEKNTHLVIHHTVTGEVPTHELASWTGRRGRIDEAMIRDIVKNIDAVEFYVCGPAAMVLAMKEILKLMNIPPEHIKSEMFTGY